MANDLASPADLADLPGAPFTDAQVDAAVAALRAHAGWHIAPPRTETLTLDVIGGSRVVLPSLRVTAVAEVRNTYEDTPVEITDFRWSEAGVLSRRYCSLPCGFRALEVDITHGYDECPPELLPSIAACAATASLSPAVASRGIGPFSESYRPVDGSVFAGDAAVARYTLPPRP